MTVHGDSAAGTPNEPCILLVEDNEVDVWFFRRAVRTCAVQIKLSVVSDGARAVAYLLGDAPYPDRGVYPLPALIVTDLKMPGMMGFELLAWLHLHAEFGQVPAMVLSGSDLLADKERARAVGAVDYIVKDASAEGLASLARRLEHWLGMPVKGGGRAAA
jgi:CheY-like chemotaxis protein